MGTPSTDLYELRETFDAQQIMVCFNGPINAALIEEIGRALRDYLSLQQEKPNAVSDIFAVYIEMTQNIRRYSEAHPELAGATNAVIVVSRDQGRYVVGAGNVVTPADGEALSQRVAGLAAMDGAALKATFKAQLRRPRENLGNSAGLGLIDMARKAAQPLQCALRAVDDQRSFFSLRVVL